MRNYAIVMMLLCVFAFTACNKSDDPKSENTYTPIDLSLKSQSLVESSNSFGVEIFKQLLQDEEEHSNALISPLSIFQALSMVRNGAKTETLAEMNDVLAFDESLGNDINEYQKKLVEALQKADSKLTLDIANSIWYRDGVDILPDFIKLNQDYFNAEVTALDFSDGEKAKTTINNWVSKQTNHKITDIVDEVSPDHVMFLINAIYFYGQWQNKFSTKVTKEESFYPELDTETKVKMMHQQAQMGYASNDLFSMVEMPYGNGHFNMVVMMPNTGKQVKDIVNGLNDETWENWMQEVIMQEVVLGFPKFKFECEYDLKKQLLSMGMPLAFSGAADFSGIIDGGGLFISKVKHKTFIKVDEKGTEAAAVTSVEMELTSAGPQQPVHFTANKPFVFAITEKDTNTILFMGKMMMPE